MCANPDTRDFSGGSERGPTIDLLNAIRRHIDRSHYEGRIVALEEAAAFLRSEEGRINPIKPTGFIAQNPISTACTSPKRHLRAVLLTINHRDQRENTENRDQRGDNHSQRSRLTCVLHPKRPDILAVFEGRQYQ